MRAFAGSAIFTVAALLLAGLDGYAESGLWAAALSAVFVAAVLGVMETSLSLDNAVVNATVLKDMEKKWQDRFLTWGILIAVFGMRVIFPLVIVSVAAWVTPWEAVRIAFSDHAQYEHIVTSAHVGISGFGGAFLALVGQAFFFDHEREHHWLPWIEKPLCALGKVPGMIYLMTAAEISLLGLLLPHHEAWTFGLAGAAGIATYFLVEKMGDWIGGGAARAGVGGFIYLEFLDASFSFDGVIGAFAITNNIVIIALGLGIGAMFVRSMTVALVRGGHLNEYRYLEHGAFYAIVALAAIMLLSVLVRTPEVVTGLIGATLIGLAFWSSVRWNKRNQSVIAEP